MENIEYTWNELNDEGVSFTFNNIKLTSLAGPEEIDGSGKYWSPARGDDGKDYDLTWKINSSCGIDSFTLMESTEAEYNK
jgi:hypothetical protein